MDSDNLKTKNEIRTVSPSRREIEVEVPEPEVQEEFQKAMAQYASRAKIAGFRIGKAPKDLVKQMFYPDIRQSVVDTLAPRVLARSLKAYGIQPVVMPVITDLHFKEGEPLRFKALVEVWPEFDLPEFKKVKVKKREMAVEEKEVEHSLEDLRQRAGDYVPVEGRGVSDGDYVMTQVQGKDLKTKKYFSTEKVVILAGQADNEKTLNENLLGLKPDEERVFVISYPADHRNKKVAGKEVEYRLKVLSIKEKKIPALDDEFAKDLGEYKNLADLKEKIREEILKTKESAAREAMGEEIIAQVAGQLTLDLPETLVAEEAEAILDRTLSASGGRSPQAADLGPLREEAKKRAVENIKRRLILRKVAKREGLAVSEEEIEAELKRLARANNLPLAKVRESFEAAERREDLKSHLLLRKAVDFLVESAIID